MNHLHWPNRSIVSKVPAALISALLLSALVACDRSSTKQPADLLVSSIEVSPSSPKALDHFDVSVYIKNDGDKPSSEYDLKMYILDVSRQQYYFIGPIPRLEGVGAGERVLVYTARDRLVNDSGAHQVYVEIQSDDDADQGNNSSTFDFFVD